MIDDGVADGSYNGQDNRKVVSRMSFPSSLGSYGFDSSGRRVYFPSSAENFLSWTMARLISGVELVDGRPLDKVSDAELEVYVRSSVDSRLRLLSSGSVPSFVPRTIASVVDDCMACDDHRFVSWLYDGHDSSLISFIESCVADGSSELEIPSVKRPLYRSTLSSLEAFLLTLNGHE